MRFGKKAVLKQGKAAYSHFPKGLAVHKIRYDSRNLKEIDSVLDRWQISKPLGIMPDIQYVDLSGRYLTTFFLDCPVKSVYPHLIRD